MSKLVEALRKVQEERSGETGPRQHKKIGRIETNHTDEHGENDSTVRIPVSGRGVSRVVQIDRDAMRDAGLIAPENEHKLFEDEYRVIKRPILSNAFGSNAHTVKDGFVVLVTSAISGDGKTFTCINLALSLAKELDSSVLLIDADVPKPHISTLFDAQDERGLTDFLEGHVTDLDEIVLQTSVEGLSIMPAGKSLEHATELLSGRRMVELVDAVHRQDPKKIILIDSSPLLQTTESRALAAVSGQVVLVVRAGITPKAAVMDAVATLDSDKPTNLVLNQVRFGRGTGYYSSYYGGGYGSANGGTDALKESEAQA